MAQVDFENLLKETMGLDSASVGSATVEGAVQLRMRSLGLKQRQDYWELLRASDSELQELIEAVVILETWFFRDRDAFAALTRVILEEWLPHHPTGMLRLLSSPCCSGEEPYSMVMALLDAGLPRDRLTIDAVDISLRAVRRAKRGIYGANSFRGEDLTFRDRYFEQSQNGYTLPEWVRQIVTFHHGNLLSPGFRIGSAPYDIIFCRNVLIYFDRETQKRVMATLDRLLAPSGLLFVGPSETFLATCSGFQSIHRSMSFAFRKASAGVRQPVRDARPRLTNAVRSPRKRPAQPAVKPNPLPAPQKPLAAAETIDLKMVRHLADAGRLREAGELCEVLLKERGPSSEAYHLLGLVEDAVGNAQRAAECYRKVLYLEPTHTEALVHLALLAEKQGNVGAAQRLRERAQRAQKGAGQ